MKSKASLASKQDGTVGGRTVLCVDPDASYAEMLHNAWQQLRLADDLRVAHSREEALALLDAALDGGNCPAAVVLDPEATGEETGAFMREVRKHCGRAKVPIVFWSQDSEKYEVLEGLGVESVLRKPGVLRLVQSLHEVCELSVHSFLPFPGDQSDKGSQA